MKNKIIKLLSRQIIHKGIKVGLITLTSFLVITAVVKAAPPTTPYNPGETLAPTCAPTDSNCTVLTPAVGTGANGYVSFWTGVSTVSGDTALYWDNSNKRLGLGTISPTAVLHLKAGTATANTAPIKLTSGTLNTTAEAGAIEFLTDAYYGTITTGGARKTFAFLESPSFTTPILGAASATSLTLTSSLAVAYGGTGAATLGDTGVLIGNGTGAIQVTSAGTSGQVLTSNGVGVDPTFQTLPASANTALSNLASVAINTTLLPGAAGTVHLGSATLPFGDIFFAGTSGTPGTNNYKITGASTSGTRTITFPDASGTVTLLGNASTGSGSVVLATSPTFVTPTLGAASATSLATSAATPLLLTNGQLVNIALTSQTTGATTLTIPDFAGVVDEFTFKTKAQTMSNKTFVAPILGVATATSIAIGANTLDTNEWANLDGVNQTLATTSTPQFARLGLGAAADATNILTVASASTTNLSKTLNITHTGAITGTGYAGYFSKTGTSTTNVGLYATASGATNNYSAIFESGNVGIGTTAPTKQLSLTGGVFLHSAGGTISTIGGVDSELTVWQVYVSGKYAYIAREVNTGTCSGATFTGCEIIIADISDPINPARVSGIDLAGGGGVAGISLFVSGKYLYVAAELAAGTCSGATVTGCDLRIYDISNPSSPAAVSGVDFPSSFPYEIQVVGKYLYTVAFGNTGTCSGVTLTGCEFRVYDVSNPASIAAVGGLDLGANALSVDVVGNYAYVTKANSGNANDFVIINISIPSAPSITGGVDLSLIAYDIYVSGKYAYLTTSDDFGVGNEFYIYNISNPASPTLAGGVNLEDDGGAVSVAGKYAYVGISANTGTCSGATLTGCEFRVYDVSNPASISAITGINIPDGFIGGGSSAQVSHGIMISGKYVYAGTITNAGTCSTSDFTGCELSIIDISGSDSPAASIGSIATNYISVSENARVDNNLYIGTGLNVGAGGILSRGPISILSGGTGAFGALDVQSSAGTSLLFVSDNGTIGIGDTTPDNILDVNSTSTNGNILTVGANSAVTVAGSSTALTGALIDLATNYTTADDDTTGLKILLDTASDTDSTVDDLIGVQISSSTFTVNGASAVPVWRGIEVTVPDATTTSGTSFTGEGIRLITTADTQSTALTTTINGLNISSAGAIIQDTLGGTYVWNGFNINMPNITQTTGTVTSTGIKITGGTVTSGTSYGLIIDSNAGNVGIGATAPSQGKLVVAQTDAANLEALYINTEESTATQTVFSIESDTINGSGADTLKFKITADGSTYSDVNTTDFSGAADVAEMYPKAEEVSAGDVVELVNKASDYPYEEAFAVRKARSGSSQKLMGVISTKPSSLMGYDMHNAEKMAYMAPVALSGRVPVKATSACGAISIGDPLTASSIPGVACKAEAGDSAIVGYALESFNASEQGVILAFINLDSGSYSPLTARENQSGVVAEEKDSLFNALEALITGFTNKVRDSLSELGVSIKNGIARFQEVVAEKFTAKQFCLIGDDGESVCVNKDQLKQLIQQNGVSLPASISTPVPLIEEPPVLESTATPESTPEPTPAPTAESTVTLAPEPTVEPTPVPIPPPTSTPETITEPVIVPAPEPTVSPTSAPTLTSE